MANKKISQLNSVDPAIGIGSVALFPICSGTGPGDFQTAKITALEIAKFVLSPMPSNDLTSVGFTGTTDIHFEKSNWVDASQSDVHNYPFLQVRKSDGLLVTGSGVAFDSATVPWNFTATADINMQGFDIIRANEIYFGGTQAQDYAVIDSSYYAGTPQINVLKIRSDDLTLSGTRYVSISGQALDLASTPISGNVTITGGDLEIDPGHKLIVNEITTYGTNAGGNDPPVIHISGAAAFKTIDATDSISNDVYWSNSNIQYLVSNGAVGSGYDFLNVRDGQTLTVYVQNTHASATVTPTFTLAGNATLDYPSPVNILWSFPTGDTVAAMKEPPTLTAGTTNVYTFVNIKTGIFASAITGYVY